MHRCSLAPGETGFCHARKNLNGKSESLNYGHITALALDSIEKKPLARFYPGSYILSVGSFGCNLRCPFCQNHQISMADVTCPGREITPEQLASFSASLQEKGNIGVAFTYNEPLIGYEFVLDTAKAVKQRGQKTVLVTNGHASAEVHEQLLPWIDAYNIDLKAYSEEHYRQLGGDLDTVCTFIRRASAAAHVELTTLVVPGFNDGEKEIRRLAAWVADVDPDITLHLTRFFPQHKMADTVPTSISQLYAVADIAKEYLNDVLLGNV